jgi:hypothetical protein
MVFSLQEHLHAGCSSCAQGTLKCTDCFNSRGGYVNEYCFDGWNIYADYLYWRVSRPGLDFAAGQNSCNEQTTLSIDPERGSGFRLGWENAMPSFALGILYTHFNNLATKQVTLETACPKSDSSVASANYCFKLDYADFILSKLCLNPTLNYSLIPYAAIRVGKLNQSFNINYKEEHTLNTIQEKTSTNFCGLIAGFQANWIYCGANTIFLECALGSHAANAEQKSRKYISYIEKHTDQTPEERFLETQIQGSGCSIIFTTEIRAGLNFDIGELFGGYISLQIGYEFDNWYKLTDCLEVLDNNFSPYPCMYISENNTNILIDGLFVRLNAAF